MDISLEQLIKLLNHTSYHATLPVEIEPQIFLKQWSVREATFSDGTLSRHVIGRHIDEGRVSSAIQHFDADMQRITTRSGRVYQLVAESGIDGDAEYVWARWCKINQVVEFTNVTDQYFR